MKTQVWIGKRTLWELIAEHTDGRQVLIQYTGAPGLKHLYHALQDQKDYILRLFGTLEFERANTHDVRFVFGAWTVRYSGRTQRDAVSQGEYPFIRDVSL